MKEYLVSKGWEFKGMCSCSPPMAKYSNTSVPNYVYYIGASRWQLKEVGALKRTVAAGPPSSFQHAYETKFHHTL